MAIRSDCSEHAGTGRFIKAAFAPSGCAAQVHAHVLVGQRRLQGRNQVQGCVSWSVCDCAVANCGGFLAFEK